MVVEKQVNCANEITSNSESIFLFKLGYDFINADFLPLKVRVNSNENLNYHLEASDLRKMNELDNSIFPYTLESGMTKNKLYEVKWVGN